MATIKKKNKVSKKPKKPSVEMTLWGVILSFPDLHNPKPYKGKTYYKTDMLFDEDHPQLGELRKAIKKVRTTAFGDDKDEWPEGAQKIFVQNGDTREDQAAYKDKLFVSVATQTPVPIVDLKGKAFNPQSVKGGMTANVAVNITTWDNEGDQGMSIYLQGVQIDTTIPSLNFGGGKSVKAMFNKGDDEDNNEEEQDNDEDDQPRSKKKKGKKTSMNFDDDDSEPLPKKKKKKSSDDEE